MKDIGIFLKRGLMEEKQEVIREYTCPGCNQTVKETKMPVIGGPEKGKIKIFNIGCKCEDISIGKEMTAFKEKVEQDKIYDFFTSNSLINEGIKDATFINYVPTHPSQKKAVVVCGKYIAAFRKDDAKSILLTGETGVGKTHLALSTLKEILREGYTGLFVSLPTLLTKIKNTYDKNNTSGVSVDKILNLIREVDLLVLDDLGAEAGTNHDIQKVFEILDSRQGKSNIYTTNLSKSDFEETFGKRNFSRIMKDTYIVPVKGNDYRLQKTNVLDWD